MKIHGWGQRGNYPLPPSRTDRETGKRLCRWCEAPVPRGRVFWCGEICIEEYRLRGDWNHLRDYIINRDKAKGCAICKSRRLSPSLVKERRAVGLVGRVTAFRTYEFWGPYNPVEYAWEVDHIVPVAEGGTDEPTNLRLLCRPCHVEITGAWRRERAAGPQLALLD